tara:strand:+ start:147 stop:401 length:255 start_codon:yes stop_codon:yes gene_type:complete
MVIIPLDDANENIITHLATPIPDFERIEINLEACVPQNKTLETMKDCLNNFVARSNITWKDGRSSFNMCQFDINDQCQFDLNDQ